MSLNDLWIEKFRPKTLNDLCISEDIKDLVRSWGASIPHLLFVGKAGCGKTSMARILVHDVLKCDYLYINASDENGIDTIRNKVTGFVQTKSLDGNIKVVILDECDFISTSAQSALRNMMETYSDTARFILTGNMKHKISEAIQSRCQSLDISPSLKDAVLRCFHILKEENIELDTDQKKSVINLVKTHFPDLRKCIGELQKHCIDGVLNIKSNSISDELIETIWENIISKNGLKTRKYLIENDGMFNSDWDQLLVRLLNNIYERNTKDEMKKAMIVTIADHLDKSTRVLDKEINFFACILNLEDFV